MFAHIVFSALVVLAHAPGLSVTELGRRVGLSQPAAARMVDALERDGLVRRERGWGRWVAVLPTELGRRAADDLLASRGGALAAAVERLEEPERGELERLLAKLLDGLYTKPGDAEHLCRLCDRAACLAQGSVCPVGQADRDHRARETPDDG
ncbi:MarR family winged helix-turn-helix transcriptional regulator [Marinitenerispora sediminis]|uniref:MarR family winged helix-turn-helix transcriptional regulator n=1 Tax=Marinitenerispora sediminis TaxID=1931232 RepID=UPI000DF20E68|nr:MarR family transcriptional regulator [Marinitenerispora sediminis]RCV60397.1 MarR family transcriptional regulator [Marinitenerispora sediminis]